MKTFKHFDEQVQTRSCQQLLAAVVAAAVNDTCVEPFKVTAKDKKTNKEQSITIENNSALSKENVSLSFLVPTAASSSDAK